MSPTKQDDLPMSNKTPAPEFEPPYAFLDVEILDNLKTPHRDGDDSDSVVSIELPTPFSVRPAFNDERAYHHARGEYETFVIIGREPDYHSLQGSFDAETALLLFKLHEDRKRKSGITSHLHLKKVQYKLESLEQGIDAASKISEGLKNKTYVNYAMGIADHPSSALAEAMALISGDFGGLDAIAKAEHELQKQQTEAYHSVSLYEKGTALIIAAVQEDKQTDVIEV